MEPGHNFYPLLGGGLFLGFTGDGKETHRMIKRMLFFFFLLYVAKSCGKCSLYKKRRNTEKCQDHFIVNNEEKTELE